MSSTTFRAGPETVTVIAPDIASLSMEKTRLRFSGRVSVGPGTRELPVTEDPCVLTGVVVVPGFWINDKGFVAGPEFPVAGPDNIGRTTKINMTARMAIPATPAIIRVFFERGASCTVMGVGAGVAFCEGVSGA